MTKDDEARQMVEWLSLRYARAFKIDRNDLIQEGWLAVAAARKTWDETRGPWLYYVRQAVATHLIKFSRREAAAPVSYAEHRLRNEGIPQRLALVTEPEPREDDSYATKSGTYVDPGVTPDLEGHVDRLAAYRRIRETVRGIPAGEVALRCLLGEATVGEAAREAGLSERKVREAKRETRRALAADPRLKATYS